MKLTYAQALRKTFDSHLVAKSAIQEHGWHLESIIDLVLHVIDQKTKDISGHRGIRGIWVLRVENIPDPGQKLEWNVGFKHFEDDEFDRDMHMHINYDMAFGMVFLEVSTTKFFALPLPYPIGREQVYSDRKCYTCRKEMQQMKRCKNCKLAIYCSKRCQSQNWPEHKVFCQMYDK